MTPTRPAPTSMTTNTRKCCEKVTTKPLATVFSIRRLRRLTQILAACLAAARQSTPPGNFCSREAAKPRRRQRHRQSEWRLAAIHFAFLKNLC